MKFRFMIAATSVAALVNVNSSAVAGAKDYFFEPVKAEVSTGEGVIVAIRLKHRRTGKPVTDAKIVRMRIDMAPDKMADMASRLTPVPSNDPGVYAFKTEISMAGRWQLSIAVKVPGELQIVAGKITFSATR